MRTEGYTVILADPCWSYRNVKTGGSHTSGAAQRYATMTVPEIADLPVQSIAAKDSVCFLWATVPLGRDPYLVLEAWGYHFVTEWVWHKVGRKGLGYWTRGEVEKLLIGKRGDVRAWRSALSNYIEDTLLMAAFGEEAEDAVVHAPVRRHSQKPEVVQDRIEALMPQARRCELFATRTRPNWDCYGLGVHPSHDFRDEGFWTGVQASQTGPHADWREVLT